MSLLISSIFSCKFSIRRLLSVSSWTNFLCVSVYNVCYWVLSKSQTDNFSIEWFNFSFVLLFFALLSCICVCRFLFLLFSSYSSLCRLSIVFCYRFVSSFGLNSYWSFILSGLSHLFSFFALFESSFLYFDLCVVFERETSIFLPSWSNYSLSFLDSSS